MSEKHYYQPEIETMPEEQIRALQSEKLVKAVQHVYADVPYYRDLMNKAGVKPEDIHGVEDLHKLPFLSKADLRETYPYGMLACPLSDCVRIQSTSGTTGKRVIAYYTQNDIDMWEECCARAIVAAGGSKEDVVHISYGYGLFTGGAGLNGGSHKVGCLTLPMSSGSTDRQIQFMMDLKSTILCCTPSYAAYIGETLKEKSVDCQQKFTEPPSRFTEASLVKDLEEKNIGRPSTYAPIIATLLERKYISREKKTLIPTELGFVVTELMEEYFKEIVDTGFTADMEDRLDEVEVKDLNWKEIVRDFYATLKDELEVADKAIEKVEIQDQITDEKCELCGRPMAIKAGRFGEFLACTGYPECKNTKAIVKSTGVKCPDCGGDIVAKRGRSGKIFYGCSNYPTCTRAFWYKPVDKKCPECGALLLERRTKGGNYVCSNEKCGYKE